LHGADRVGVTVFEQRIELRSVALELGPFVEHFAERLLNDHDLVADTNLSTQLLLKVRRGAQVIGMDMGFDDPVKRQPAVLDFCNQGVRCVICDPTCGIVDVHDTVDDGAMIAVGILDDIGDGVGRLVKMGGNLGFDGHVDRVGHVFSSS
jgi:hypothetical protein